MAIKQLSAFVENKPGALYELIRMLKDANINIRAMNLADTKDFGVLRMIVEDNNKTKDVLGDNTIVITTDVLAVEMPDKPGAFCDIIEVLVDAGINIEYAYAFVTPTESGAYTVIRVDKVEVAEDALLKKGFSLLTQSNISQL